MLKGKNLLNNIKLNSISIKLNTMLISTSLLILIVGFGILSYKSSQVTDALYQEIKATLIEKAKNEIASKMNIGITNAISISNDQRIKKALLTNNRTLAINALNDISQNMKKYTKYRHTKIHLHTKENLSFIRSWKVDKYGDDLSSFRSAVVTVNQKLKPILTFEAGRAGLLLRAITPIIDKDNQHLGSLEFIQGIDSVVKRFSRKNEGFLLLMKKKFSKGIKHFKKAKEFQNYIISQESINRVFLEDAKNINLRELFQEGYALGKKYFYTYTTIRDYRQQAIGVVLLGKPLFNVNNAIKGANKIISLAISLMFAIIFISTVIIIIYLKKLVINPLKKFETGLLDFFQFLQEEKKETQSIEIDSNDEFGLMAKSVNENIIVSIHLHKEIKELNNKLEERVKEKTQKVTALLNNAGQGFLSFSYDFTIDKEYSNECVKLLGESIEGEDIAKLLFKDKTKENFFRQTLLDIFYIEDLEAKHSMITLLPSEILLNRRMLKIEYKFLENHKTMLILSNISSQKKLEQKVKEKQEVLKMIVEIVSDSELFFDIKKEFEYFSEHYQEYVKEEKTSLHNINDIYRVIHTFKGAFSQLYMSNSANNLHLLESQISLLIKDNQHTNTILLTLLQSYDFKSSFNKEIFIVKDVLGEEFFNAKNFVQIPSSDIKILKSDICSLFAKKEFHSQEAKEIISKLTHFSSPKLMKLLKPYKHSIQQLARRLNKEVYEVKIIGDEELIVNESFKPFFKSFIHIFRNAIDHGIETPEERLLKGKDEVGTISCSFEEKDTILEIIIADDGAGMDKEKLLHNAIKNNIITKEESTTLDEKDIYHLIFKEQFTTKQEISNISGRGVGMSAVEYELKKLKGTIIINTQKDKGSSFIFTIPKGATA